MRALSICFWFLYCCTAVGQIDMPSRSIGAIPEPRDKSFRSEVALHVEAMDTAHGVFHVVEEIPIQASGPLVLLYPEWETTSHGPTASAAELAGLQVQIDGQNVQWRRDVRDIHAFHLTVPPGAKALTVAFEYLSPRGAAELRPHLIDVQWQRLLLYPAGWYLRDIQIAAQLHIPIGLTPFTSLQTKTSSSSNGLYAFDSVTLDRLVDSPVYAAKYARRLELAPENHAAVYLDLMAEDPSELAISAQDESALRVLVAQTGKVFGRAPYQHYDALVSLSDNLAAGGGGGLEHLDEGENNLPENYFTAPERQLNNKDLIVHEYVHVWNGRFRQPVGLWLPNLNSPTDPSLLWVYEGQTEFWGRVLAARSGLRTTQQTLDKLALDAALVENRSGRLWKTLEDSTLDVLYMPGHAIAWRDWQRREDYYSEGVLLWLDVDARLRELSHGKMSLDDFARLFFASHGPTGVVSTYDFNDVCDTLTQIVPSDWHGFLTRHLLTHDTSDAMSGLARAGWRLTYTMSPSDTLLQDEVEAGVTNLDFSLGMQIRADGTVRSAVWNGVAFNAGLAPGTQITAVNGRPYSRKEMLGATSAARSIPIILTLQDNGVSRQVTLAYTGTLRYPHLERIAGTVDRLTPLLAALS